MALRAHKMGTTWVASRGPPAPTARGGAIRRCSSPSSPSPSPPPPPGGGGGGGGAAGLPPPPSGGGSSPGPGPGSGGGGTQPWRVAAQVCAGLAVTAGLAAAAAPSVLSTQWGLQRAMELANRWLPGRVEVAEARLSWLGLGPGGNELQCVKVYDSPRGGTILLHLNRVSTSASLWALLAGGGDFNLVISKPWINAVYDPRASEFKLLAWMERAGLLGEPEPPPAEERAARRHPAAAAGQGDSAAKQPGPKQQQQQQQPPPAGSMAAVLARVNAKMDFHADVRLGRAAVVVADGMLLVPQEIREALGPSLHVTGALGARELAEWAGEVGEDVSWAAGAAASPTSAAPAAAAAVGGVTGGGGGGGGGGAAAAAASPGGVVSPPAEVLRRPADFKPGIVQIHSEHLAAEMRLWHAAGGGASLLHQPARAALALTPALSKLGLASANPVLGDAVEVHGSQERLQLSFMPAGGRLPYTAATVETAPVTLALGAASLLPATLSELGLPRLSTAAAAATSAPAAAATSAPAAAAGGGGAAAGGSPGLPVSVSRMVVHFTRGGELRTERVDMRLGGDGDGGEDGGGGGGGGGGVRLAVWGSADMLEDSMDFTLGVDPAPLLSRLGLSTDGLPEGYLLLVPLRGGGGGRSAPVYDVAAAARRLGQLVARQKAAQWAEGREQRRERGEGPRGLLAGGLHAVLSAVAPEEQLRTAIDAELRAERERIPPPLPQAPRARSGSSV